MKAELAKAGTLEYLMDMLRQGQCEFMQAGCPKASHTFSYLILVAPRCSLPCPFSFTSSALGGRLGDAMAKE